MYRIAFFYIFNNPISKFLIEILEIGIYFFTFELFFIEVICKFNFWQDLFSNSWLEGQLSLLFDKFLVRHVLLGDRVDLVMKKIKLIISSEITIIDRGAISWTNTSSQK